MCKYEYKQKIKKQNKCIDKIINELQRQAYIVGGMEEVIKVRENIVENLAMCLIKFRNNNKINTIKNNDLIYEINSIKKEMAIIKSKIKDLESDKE